MFHIKLFFMRRLNTLILIFSLFSISLTAQMWNGVDTLYGNEWIDFEREHYKIMIAEDGMYKISTQTLTNNGIPSNAIQNNQLRLYYMGQEVPLYNNSTSIEFYGQKNKGSLDEHLFENPMQEMANPQYSIFTDSSAYFLTWDNTPSSNKYINTPNDLNNAPTTPETHCLYTEKQIFNDRWSKPRYPQAVYLSRFEMAEGFVSPFQLSQTITLEPQAIFQNGPESKLYTRYSTINQSDQSITHEQEIKLNGNSLSIDNFIGARTHQDTFTLSASSLLNSMEVSFDGLYNDRDKQGVAYVMLTYPRLFDFGGNNSIEFEMPASTSSQYLKIDNFDAGSVPILYDLTNKLRIEGTISGTEVKIALPASSVDRKLILVNSNTGISEVTNLSITNFIDYTQTDKEYIIISNKNLFSDQNGTNWVQEYADYRSSPAGRSYLTEVVEIQQLYDQFAYGVNRHSMSIRNFGHFIKKIWTAPQYVFIIGKGRTYNEIRTQNTLNTAIDDGTFQVPTFGTKGGGDNLLLTSTLSNAPIISIGRIPASKANDVRIYLDKVMAHETAQNSPQSINNKEWMKRLIHLGGGNSSEQTQFKGYLNTLKNVIENNSYGGKVTSFFKQSSDPIQISQSDELTNLINDGVSIISFFGHASSGTFDYSIDNASFYENEGKYPIMFSFGCYSGNMHTSERGISEDFVLTEKKGAIAFFASTATAFAGDLFNYGQEFYNQIGGNSFGLGIGDVSRIAIKQQSAFIGFLGQQMTLNGDPSIRIGPQPGPDYVIDKSSVIFDPNPISIQNESFNLSFDIVNLGKNTLGNFLVEVEQELPNGTRLTVVTDSISAPGNRTKLNYTLPTLGNEVLGANKFFIEIDKNNSIAELPIPEAESNNYLINDSNTPGITVHFISNEVLPVFPEKFGIVNNPNLTLKASTSSTFIESQKYVIEIDTSALFNSPIKESTEIIQKGGIIKWKPNIAYQNNTVYYWRISPEENPDIGGFIWRESSFLYLTNTSEGWNQSHFFQFQEDRFSNIELPQNRLFKFITDFKDLSVDVFAVDSIFNPNIPVSWYSIGNEVIDVYWGLPNGGVYVVVLDPFTLEPWENNEGNGGFFNSLPYSWTDFAFAYETQSEGGRSNLINFLNNDIPNGHYVLIYTTQKVNTSYEPEEWESDLSSLGTTIFDLLETQGATEVRSLSTIGAVPYAFFYQKGNGALNEKIAATSDEFLAFDYAIPGSWDEGFIESTIIGPASNWDNLEWNITSLDNIPGDEYSIDIFGIDTNGNDSLLMNTQSFNTDLSSLLAEEFPYLKLRFNSKDSLQKSSVHLDYWRVYYKGLPEIALNPASLFTFQSDSLNQGELLSLDIGLENIGRYDMDSVLIKYTITDGSNQQNIVQQRIAPIMVNDTLIAHLDFDTRSLSGRNTIAIEANPDKDQLEQFHFNNLGFIDFFVNKDRRNPLLDVTFDGFHIMDGDLVSSKPNIMITLKDENQFLALNDTSLINVFLQSPFDETVQPMAIDGDTLTFYPADGSGDNKARLEFKPELLQDGTYTLLVQAQDISGNQSGNLDYKVSFVINNTSSISKVLNYPNPFSTSTKFVFTITGDEIPTDMKIQIMTISGRIVKEITQAELGPIHVGNNITEFSWDGTDDYGDKLANGVYLYRVVAQKANGESFDAFNTKADQFFKNGFGKMVILR